MKETKQRLTIRMPDELNKVLTEKANKIGVSKNGLILQILWEKVNEENNLNKLKLST
ncbi:toxin-antitoxin system HicB family antitoxin [Clostridium baratii]